MVIEMMAKVMEYEIRARTSGLFREDTKSIVRGTLIYNDQKGFLITETVYDSEFIDDIGKLNIFELKSNNEIMTTINTIRQMERIGNLLYLEEFEIDDIKDFALTIWGDEIAKKLRF